MQKELQEIIKRNGKNEKYIYVDAIVLLYLWKRGPREGEVALMPLEIIWSMLEEMAFRLWNLKSF